MTFEGITYDDDYLVIWRGLVVGRLLKQSGVAWGQPDWYWGINFGHRPQTGNMRGNCRNVDEAKAAFQAAWDRLRPGIDDAEIEAARRHDRAVEARLDRR
jgi:hypothetical protein